MLKRCIVPVCALAFFILQSQAAFACGGLIAPDGDVRLDRATTFVAWHNGIEHYLTSFTYQEANTHAIPNLGWIVPLPAVPLKIEEGGAWTLQRLALETRPPEPTGLFVRNAATASAAQVLQQVKIEALNISVVKGSGQAVLDWATGNGFFLNGDTRQHLLTYAQGSPIFLAAKFDTAAARARHQISGDGTPILITMRTTHIWVPLEVLALDGQQVQADLYLLTDGPVNTSDFGAFAGQSPVGTEVPGAPGMHVAFQERMNSSLYHDLSTDRNMGWVWPDSWITYLNLDAPDTAVTYDLGVSSNGIIRIAPFGTAPMAVVDGQISRELPSWLPRLPLGTPQFVLTMFILGSLAAAGFFFLRVQRRRTSSDPIARS